MYEYKKINQACRDKFHYQVAVFVYIPSYASNKPFSTSYTGDKMNKYIILVLYHSLRDKAKNTNNQFQNDQAGYNQHI